MMLLNRVERPFFRPLFCRDFLHGLCCREYAVPSAWFIYNNRKLEFPDGLHGLYVISSNLVEDQAINCLTCIWFNPYIGDGWTAPIMRKDIPLPTQMCCCHRIEIITDGPDDQRISAVISERVLEFSCPLLIPPRA